MATIECPIYLSLGQESELSDSAPIVISLGGKVTWHNLRRQGTIRSLPREKTLHNLRRQVTFGKGYKAMNQDPFEVSKGGKLVDQLLFLNPLRLRSDPITGTPTATVDQDGFTVSNIAVNNVPTTNEEGIEFPEGTVIQFDIEAPGSLGEDLEFDEALIYFNFVSTAGLTLRISHPIRVVDAVEVQ